MKTRTSRIVYIAVVGGIGIFCTCSSYFFSYREGGAHHGHAHHEKKLNYNEVNDSDEIEDLDVVKNPNTYLIN